MIVRPKDRHLEICLEDLRRGYFSHHVWICPYVRPGCRVKESFYTSLFIATHKEMTSPATVFLDFSFHAITLDCAN